MWNAQTSETLSPHCLWKRPRKLVGLLVRNQRHQGKGSSPPRLAVAQLLPVEILLQIFEDLIPSVNTFAAADSKSCFVLSPIRACRLWCVAGTIALYSKICLLSHGRMLLFARSLKRNPALAKLVQDVCMVDLDNEYYHLPFSFARFLKRRFTINWHNLAINLNFCAIIGGNDPCLIAKPLPPTAFIRGLPCDSSVRRLILLERHGYWGDVRTPPNDISHFTNLQILSFRECRFTADIVALPSLPKLHTLQLVHCYISSYCMDALTITHNSFPSLRTLQLFRTSSSVRVDEGCLQRLTIFQFVGHLRSSLLSTTPNLLPSPFHVAKNLRSFALGCYDTPGTLGHSAMLTSLERAPESIKTLSIAIRKSCKSMWMRRNQGLTDIEVLKCLNRLLLERRLVLLTELNLLIIYQLVDVDEIEKEDEILAELESLEVVCLDRGITLSVSDSDLFQWMDENLSDALENC